MYVLLGTFLITVEAIGSLDTGLNLNECSCRLHVSVVLLW